MSLEKSVPAILKQELDEAISIAIDKYKEEYGELKKSNFSRKRVLTRETMIKLLLSFGGGSLNKELHEAGINVTASAFSQQRDKLSSMLFEEVFEQFNNIHHDTKTYKGYKVLAVDGTTVNMPRNPKSDTFVTYDGNPKGYNQYHVNPLYDVLNKTYQHCVIQPQPQQDEVGALTFMLQWYNFTEKTLIVADRGYESYNVFCHLMNTPNVDFLIRVKQNNSAMREIKKLPMMELDTDVSFVISTTQTKFDKENNHILLQVQKN